MTPIKRWHRLLLAMLIGVMVVQFTSDLSIARAQTLSPQQELVDRYAPIVFLRQQEEACDRRGAVIFPAPVDFVLDNPEVALKQAIPDGNSSTDPVIKTAPSAQDLAGLGDDFYLDFPGNPRRPGCIYDQDFLRFVAEQNLVPTTYARIFTDQENQKIIVTYWFWYYFNDWNNTHEGDWERVSLVFDTASIEEALTQDPIQLGYAQHGGGELADWDEDKVSREGDRLNVFAAVGAGASFYEQRLYLGWGENGTGFGCDDTRRPSNRYPLDVVLIPDDITADGPFAWLLFGGRWGERQPWEFNGPRGPNNGNRWTDPLTSMENWRGYTLFVPDRVLITGNAASTFCDLSQSGSRIVTSIGTNRWALALFFAGFLGLLGYILFTARKDISAAIRVIRTYPKTFLGLGLFAIGIGVVANTATALLRLGGPTEWLIRWFNDTATAGLFLAGAIGGIQIFFTTIAITPPIIEALSMIQRGENPTIRKSFNGYRYFWPMALAGTIDFAVVGGLVLLILTIPVAIWIAVRWLFSAQAIGFEDAVGARQGLARSSAIVHDHWFQTLKRTIAFQVLTVMPGPLIGMGLLVFGSSSVLFANIISGLVLAFTVPLSVTGMSLIYLRIREVERSDTHGLQTGTTEPGPME